jgi:hypothetical protein
MNASHRVREIRTDIVRLQTPSGCNAEYEELYCKISEEIMCKYFNILVFAFSRPHYNAFVVAESLKRSLARLPKQQSSIHTTILPVLLCVETWLVTLQKEKKSEVFRKEAATKMSVYNTDEVRR